MPEKIRGMKFSSARENRRGFLSHLNLGWVIQKSRGSAQRMGILSKAQFYKTSKWKNKGGRGSNKMWLYGFYPSPVVRLFREGNGRVFIRWGHKFRSHVARGWHEVAEPPRNLNRAHQSPLVIISHTFFYFCEISSETIISYIFFVSWRLFFMYHLLNDLIM